MPTAADFYNPLNVLGIGHNDPTSFTQMNGGKAPAPGQLAPEGIDPSQDSLTQSLRSLTNYTGQAGQDTFKTGQDVFNRGKATLEEGKDRLQAPMDYYGRLLSGDRASIASAVGPESDAISQQFGQVRKMFSQTGARGGGSTSVLAQSPFDEIRQLTDLISKARTGAAQGEGQLATTEAGIGGSEAGLGLTESGQGAGLLQMTQQGLLARRGQNYQVDMNNTNNLTKGLESVLSGPLSDLVAGKMNDYLF